VESKLARAAESNDWRLAEELLASIVDGNASAPAASSLPNAEFGRAKKQKSAPRSQTQLCLILAEDQNGKPIAAFMGGILAILVDSTGILCVNSTRITSKEYDQLPGMLIDSYVDSSVNASDVVYFRFVLAFDSVLALQSDLHSLFGFISAHGSLFC
jgi:hypothetical protein